MILKWLNETFESYFNESASNRIILFFDPSSDYSDIVDKLIKRERNYEIVKDEKSLLKTKYNIEFLNPDKRFVVYLPFPSTSKEISYLKEYIYTGKVFSDTLYIFLKTKNVKFPADKKVSDIKKILPRLALESIDKEEDYWTDVFERGNSELVLPDFRDKLFRFLLSPGELVEELQAANQLDAFIMKMETEYGFIDQMDEPENYRFRFVCQLCFTEVFEALNNPYQYPFQDYVAEKPVRANNLKLIKEIRSNINYHDLYFNISNQIEKKFDVSNLAVDYALSPAVETFREFDVKAREKLNKIAEECNSIDSFIKLFFENKDLIINKSNGFWGKQGDIREWGVLVTLSDFIENVQVFLAEIGDISNDEELITKYCEKYYVIDNLYRKYVTDSAEIDDTLENVYEWIEKIHLKYLDKINSVFSEHIFEKTKWEFNNIQFQGEFVKKLDIPDKSKIAVIIVDGLRYELGMEVVERLSDDFHVKIEPMYAQIPTVTEVGMAAMLSPEKYEFDCDSKGITVSTNGKSISDKKERIAYLESKIKKVTFYDINDFNNTKTKLLDDIKSPVFIFSKDPDKLMEAGGFDFLQFISQNLTSITKAVKRLIKANYSQIYIITDHGFLTFKDQNNNYKIQDKPGFLKDSRRFACGDAIANDDLVRFDLLYSKKSLYFPRSIYYFKKNSFLHGGISIHEAIIPYIQIQRKENAVKKIDIHVEMDEGISNRIFEVKVKPSWSGLQAKPRTVEVLAYHKEDLISNKPAAFIESKEESFMVRLLPEKFINQGDIIKIIVRDQETREILYEAEKKALKTFEDDF